MNFPSRLTHRRQSVTRRPRWISRDPLNKAESRQGPNLYRYAQNNPLNYIDFTGLAVGAAGAATGAGEAGILETVSELGPVALLVVIVNIIPGDSSRVKTTAERNWECQRAAEERYDDTCDNVCAKIPCRSERNKCYADALRKYSSDIRDCNRRFPLYP